MGSKCLPRLNAPTLQKLWMRRLQNSGLRTNSSGRWSLITVVALIVETHKGITLVVNTRHPETVTSAVWQWPDLERRRTK